jgi:hypothetical protein
MAVTKNKMGYSTVQINKPQDGQRGELVSTSDMQLAKYLGQVLPVSIVNRYSKNVQWHASDNGKLFAEFDGEFVEFEL